MDIRRQRSVGVPGVALGALSLGAAYRRTSRLRRIFGLVLVSALLALVALAPGLPPLSSPPPARAALSTNASGWEVQSAPAGLKPHCSYLTGIWGASSSSVFALARCGNLIRYNGSKWVLSNPGPLGGQDDPDGGAYSAYDIWGTSASNVFVCGHFWPPDIGGLGGVYRFHAGGWTLSESLAGDSTCVNSIWGHSASEVFAVGNDDVAGFVFHYHGGSWSMVGSFEEDGLFADCSLRGVWGSSSSNVFAVGGGMWHSQNGVVFRYNGGAWQPMSIGSAPRLLAVWGSSGSNVFAVGEAGTILHYNGSSWNPMVSGTTKDLRGIWGSSGSDVFAAGEAGTILHYNGSAWTPMASGTAKNLNAIWGSASAGFFAVGEGATILHYEDYPDQPSNVSPANGATGVSLTPALQGSTYADADGDAHVASSWQIRSSTGNYDKPAWESGKTSPPATAITVPAGKLNNSTVYYWRVGYQQAGGRWSAYSKETSFTTVQATAVPPTVVTDAAGGTGSTSATLNLSLTSLGSASSVQVSFEWGPGSAYGNTTTPQTMTSTGSFSYPLTGLVPGTTYYVRARAVGDGTSYGGDQTFTTPATPVSPPTVVTDAATGTAMDAATLRGTLTGLGSAASVQTSFEWGSTVSYGNSTPATAMAATGSFSADLGGLAAGTTYHYRATAVGDDTAYGSDMTFTTSTTPTTPPVVATDDADSITASSARLNGNLTSPGTADSVSVSFVWGTAQGGPYPNETAGAVQQASGAFRFDLSGLASGTTFYCKARAVGDGASYGVERSFTTGTAATSPRAPSIGSLVASNGRPGDDLTVTISGANLSGATAVSFGAGITINDFRVVSDTEITVKVTIGSAAEAGRRDVTVATPSGTATSLGGFTVNEVGSGVHLWVYLVAIAGAVVGLGLLASLVAWLMRRRTGPQ